MGQYYQAPPPAYGPQPYAPEPPEAGSIKSMMNIAGILALLFGILFILGGIVMFFFIFIFAIPFIIFAIIDFIIWVNCKEIIRMVDARQYEQAKSKTLIWMVLGFILGGLLIGLIILIAYLKFDSLINAARQQQGYGHQQPYAAPPQQAPPSQQRLCLGCGQQIPLNYNNCPHCGRQAQPATGAAQHGGTRMCLGCGQQIQASYAVCPHCGKHMGQ